MTSDRELLELAAKAAGIDLKECPCNECGDMGYYMDGCFIEWGSLTDNDDAFRLMVKLKLLVLPSYAKQFVIVESYSKHDEVQEELGTDPEAATRRAITRAAAEFGRNMK